MSGSLPTLTPSGPPRTVLLTGATGSLGGHLCAELLTATTATVLCLVRAADPEAARARLEARLSALDEPPARAVHRLSALPGDLQRSGFGLPGDVFDALAESVDTVVHSAASINLVADYEELAPVNLGALRHLLTLARRRQELTGRPPVFHHVSTLGTLLAARRQGLAEVDENTPVTELTSGPFGYPRTKAACEGELRRAAAEFGLPVHIYRPAVVTGHSRTGRTAPAADLLVPLMRAAVALGAAPTTASATPAERVDVVARALVALVNRADAPSGRAYHLVQPDPLPLTDLFGALRRAGHRLDPLPPALWWQRVEDHAGDPDVQPMAALRDVGRYLLALGEEHVFPSVRADATWKALTETGVTAPPLDAAYLDRLVAALELPRRNGAPATLRVRAARAAPPAVRIDRLLTPLRFDTAALPPDPAAAATACESYGYGGLWAQEQNHDPLLPLAVAAHVTSTLPLGTGVLIALARSPMTTALAAHDLHTTSGGRLTLGLGPQFRANLEHRYSMPGDRRLGRLREYVAALRHIWSSWNEDRPLSFRGEFYKHTLTNPFFTPPPSPYGPPRIVLAATGPKAAELAGEIADGLIAPPYANRRHLIEVLLPALERGLARSGRDRTDFHLIHSPLTVTGGTAAERTDSEQQARTLVALWCGTRAYRPVFAPYGLAPLADRLAELSLEPGPDRWRRMAEQIDDATLDLFATRTDRPADLGGALRSQYGGLADHLVLPAPSGQDPCPARWHPDRLGLCAADPHLTPAVAPSVPGPRAPLALPDTRTSHA
ncbi:TIGR03617 family F420-dependent LLM class oxidoreductase [Streptomyces sp. Je 1-369]|uniref:TIGR03617 family F420-dependent LLM class oxidoreductase n=1 Tax=Streptomyces sp. Je 1-369 TaxID=2966192 RepID=UPI0022854672|nr:TIGR03617 family F420-dependent LLM class oxidoreductase [Streptomyces sp. Je 1-369]WAL93212.1 TIGR03617 family F420-dependent LLM class oxidoreductase [Streptomyces sp. Je 1-369]